MPDAPLPQPASNGGLNWHTLDALPTWQRVDFISDLHLQASEPFTAHAWQNYLQQSAFDALFILGDLFEVWVGDDALDTHDEDPEHRFIRQCCEQLRLCARQRPVYLMHGNRDFLLSTRFALHTGVTLLPDPSVLRWHEQNTLLTHGDAWCLDDHDYMRFRAEVRGAPWQQAFLARPLQEREALARRLRADSEARKTMSRDGDASITWADVDTPLAEHWLQATNSQRLIHGHTHHPAEHELSGGMQRLVLSDWDLGTCPPRAEALRLQADGHSERINLIA